MRKTNLNGYERKAKENLFDGLLIRTKWMPANCCISHTSRFCSRTKCGSNPQAIHLLFLFCFSFFLSCFILISVLGGFVFFRLFFFLSFVRFFLLLTFSFMLIVSVCNVRDKIEYSKGDRRKNSIAGTLRPSSIKRLSSSSSSSCSIII